MPRNYVVSAENLIFPDNSFDVITACQCYWYFNHEQTAPIFYKLLKNNGRLLFLRMDWLPFEDKIANASENLVLKYNPNWSGANNTMQPISIPECYNKYFDIAYHEEYKLTVPFTRETWHGRMKSCRGVGASLSDKKISLWEQQHIDLLNDIAPNEFDVLHYAALVELKKKNLYYRRYHFMWNNPNIFLNKKPNIDKLIQYGFECKKDIYSFSKNIIDNTFSLNVYITESGVTKFEVIDKESNEEYTLIFNSSAVGSFVGSVRSECETFLNDIVEKCYEPHIFKSEYAKLIISYIKEKYNAEAEYLWDKFPNNAIFRESKTEKWFAALLTVEKRKIGIDADGTIEIIDLKETPERVLELVDGVKYLSGYHMNKKHWYTICLDESVSIEEIYVRIDKSFNALLKKK